MLDFAIEDAQMPSRSLLHILLRQSLAVLVLALLLGGLMTTRAEAIVLIVGLIVAGPVLTLLLPRIPMPAVLTRATRRPMDCGHGGRIGRGRHDPRARP